MNSKRTSAATCAALLAILLVGPAHVAAESDPGTSDSGEIAAESAPSTVADEPDVAPAEVSEPRTGVLMVLGAILFWASPRRIFFSRS